MAAEYRHKQYFRLRLNDSTIVTFSSTSDANTKIGFQSQYNTSSPTKTESLEDSGKTLVVLYEFNNKSDQDAFKTAVSVADTTAFDPPDFSHTPEGRDNAHNQTPIVENFKNEWLDGDGNVTTE